MVTFLRRNVPVVCGASYHLLGYQISQDSKIRFQLQVKSYISDWLFSESRLLASYVSRHKAMAYDTDGGVAPAGDLWEMSCLVGVYCFLEVVDGDEDIIYLVGAVAGGLLLSSCASRVFLGFCKCLFPARIK